ncbi:MAG: hypothetical protein K2P52_08505 [Campylobacterales bacterium]|jgi:hypothetical protein|nr:hypothetical protein [Campylobacterales bacterium]
MNILEALNIKEEIIEFNDYQLVEDTTKYIVETLKNRTKKCSQCKDCIPESEFRTTSKGYKDSFCIDCRKKYYLKYREDHKEELKQYIHDNRAKINKRASKWQTQSESYKKYKREYTKRKRHELKQKLSELKLRQDEEALKLNQQEETI